MLRHHNGVVHACDNLQFSFQVLGFGQQTALGIALGIVLRCAHVAFSVHHLVPFPVDYWSASYAHFEHFGMCGDKVSGHKSTETPSMYAHAIFVYVG